MEYEWYRKIQKIGSSLFVSVSKDVIDNAGWIEGDSLKIRAEKIEQKSGKDDNGSNTNNK